MSLIQRYFLLIFLRFNARLINWDFSQGLPNEIKDSRFDYIISTYAIHHLTDKEKIGFIELLITLLNENGKVLIGDVSFETRNDLETCKEKYKELWDDDATCMYY